MHTPPNQLLPLSPPALFKQQIQKNTCAHTCSGKRGMGRVMEQCVCACVVIVKYAHMCYPHVLASGTRLVIPRNQLQPQRLRSAGFLLFLSRNRNIQPCQTCVRGKGEELPPTHRGRGGEGQLTCLPAAILLRCEYSAAKFPRNCLNLTYNFR